jgi:hypothetical protein
MKPSKLRAQGHRRVSARVFQPSGVTGRRTRCAIRSACSAIGQRSAVKCAARRSKRAPTRAFARRRAGKRTGDDDMSQSLSRTASCQRPWPTSKTGSASSGIPSSSRQWRRTAQPGRTFAKKARRRASHSQEVAGWLVEIISSPPGLIRPEGQSQPDTGGMSQIGRIVTVRCPRSGRQQRANSGRSQTECCPGHAS